MTEDTGWDESAPEPPAPVAEPEPAAPAWPLPVAEDPAPAGAVSEPQEAAPLPGVNADPQEVAEEAAAAEPADHVLPPFIPDQGVADWLREAFRDLHDRLRALGG